MFKRAYSIYALTLFLLIFLPLFPLFVIFSLRKEWHPWALSLNQFWANIFFTFILMRYRLIGREHLEKGKQYIFCPNHFSYLDIPSMGLIPKPFKFIGKNSVSKVPLFGYMFKKLHIAVDRNNLRDRHRSFEKGKQALLEGLSLVVFPEGGIMTKNPPHMAPFKSGAFKMAIELQIPIIPVTIPYNWILLPDDNRFLMKNGKASIIFHEPVFPDQHEGNEETLRQEVRSIIENELHSTFK